MVEYWLSSIKIVTVLIFIVTGTLVDGGLNRDLQATGRAHPSAEALCAIRPGRNEDPEKLVITSV